MELRLAQEERDRHLAKSQSLAAAAQGSTAQLEEDRDRALAELQDLRQQLTAVAADLEMAKSDSERIATARNNLQMALESFQTEREAELGMLEEQWSEKQHSMAEAHAAALEATYESHQVELREIQEAANQAVQNSMEEIKQLETKLEQLRTENVQTRRSLDEAIHRLQSTQEDVIDRQLMKNILMDWLTNAGHNSKERAQVLELMASVLHFTDEEKEKVHISNVHTHGGIGAIKRVGSVVAAPLPPSRADVEHLEGDNVREKFVNFLMAETESFD